MQPEPTHRSRRRKKKKEEEKEERAEEATSHSCARRQMANCRAFVRRSRLQNPALEPGRCAAAALVAGRVQSEKGQCCQLLQGHLHPAQRQKKHRHVVKSVWGGKESFAAHPTSCRNPRPSISLAALPRPQKWRKMAKACQLCGLMCFDVF